MARIAPKVHAKFARCAGLTCLYKIAGVNLYRWVKRFRMWEYVLPPTTIAPLNSEMTSLMVVPAGGGRPVFPGSRRSSRIAGFSSSRGVPLQGILHLLFEGSFAS